MLVARGKQLLARSYPGPVGQPIQTVGGYSSPALPGHYPHPQPVTNLDMQQTMRDLYLFPLAVYLCAFADTEGSSKFPFFATSTVTIDAEAVFSTPTAPGTVWARVCPAPRPPTAASSRTTSPSTWSSAPARPWPSPSGPARSAPGTSETSPCRWTWSMIRAHKLSGNKSTALSKLRFSFLLNVP